MGRPFPRSHAERGNEDSLSFLQSRTRLISRSRPWCVPFISILFPLYFGRFRRWRRPGLHSDKTQRIQPWKIHTISDSIFRSDSGSQRSFADPAMLTFGPDGTVRISSKYNPRWSGRLALSLTIVLLCFGAWIFHAKKGCSCGSSRSRRGHEPGCRRRLDRSSFVQLRPACERNVPFVQHLHLTRKEVLPAFHAQRVRRHNDAVIDGSRLQVDGDCRIAEMVHRIFVQVNVAASQTLPTVLVMVNQHPFAVGEDAVQPAVVVQPYEIPVQPFPLLLGKKLAFAGGAAS